MFRFEQLNVYKESLSFVDLVYKLTDKWPKAETFSLTDQLKRAAISVSLNIAEGSSRTSKDFQHFLSTARGSVYECVASLTIALKRNYIDKQDFEKGYEFCDKLARMLTALKKSV